MDDVIDRSGIERTYEVIAPHVRHTPVHMGYTAVETMVKHLKGQPVEKWIDTGVHVATKENMDTPDIKPLIEPALAK